MIDDLLDRVAIANKTLLDLLPLGIPEVIATIKSAREAATQDKGVAEALILAIRILADENILSYTLAVSPEILAADDAISDDLAAILISRTESMSRLSELTDHNSSAKFWSAAVDATSGNAEILSSLADSGDGEAAAFLGLCSEDAWGLPVSPEKCIRYYRLSAERNNSAGALGLGHAHFDGRGTEKDEFEAFKWFEKSSELGNRNAINMVGWCHSEGLGTAKDNDKAIEFFRKAAEFGSHYGANNLALAYKNGSGIPVDLSESLKWFEVAAGLGRADSMNMAGRYYEEGWGTEKDTSKAVQFFRRAADAGDASGAYNLGRSYFSGSGVSKDLAAALKWYEVAAERENADAMNKVGECYEAGRGTEKNPSKAVEFFRRAADAGHASGAYNLGRSYYSGTGISKDLAAALRWYEIAAKRGNADAMNMAGRYYWEGWGTEKDPSKAVEFFRRAAEAGHAVGAYNLGKSYFSGTGISKDLAAALKWFEVSAVRGDADAMNMAGRCYLGGWGTEKDPSKAVEFFRRAAEVDHGPGMTNLGLVLSGGHAVEENLEQAAYWLRRSMEIDIPEAYAGLACLHRDGGSGVIKSVNEARRLFKIAAEKGVAWAADALKALPEVAIVSNTPTVFRPIPRDLRFVKLDAMTGLTPVKEQLRALAQRMDHDVRRRHLGKPAPRSAAHMLFVGNPGTGKTTVARYVGEIMASIGFLARGHVVEVSRTTLLGSYIGHTEKNTDEAIQKALDGVLFVDEAYTLIPDGPASNDFGPKAMDVILQRMEEYRTRLIVIFAGYEDQIDRTLNYNAGMRGRFPYKINFPDYEPTELFDICLAEIRKKFGLTSQAVTKLRTFIKQVYAERDHSFANARTMRDLAMIIETKGVQRVGNTLLEWIEAADIPDPTPVAEKKDPIQNLNEMIGLSQVKQQVKNWQNKIKVENIRKEQGIFSSNSSVGHMVFAGNPGTGKTEVARIVGRILFSLGQSTKSEIRAVTRSDLVGQYLGQTAPRVRRVFAEATGGVLFIDEAYSLVSGDNDSFGNEAVTELITCVENMRSNVTVILAGYKNQMDEFLATNPGLKSRFRTMINFEDYSPTDLLLIFEKMVFEKGLHLTSGARKKAEEVILQMHLSKGPQFGNARDIRNLFAQTEDYANSRLVSLINPDYAQITEEDIRLP
jgi:TPR repeat protein/SpoVK/Ycf46/Vps4 family AAA+-type ATPase